MFFAPQAWPTGLSTNASTRGAPPSQSATSSSSPTQTRAAGSHWPASATAEIGDTPEIVSTAKAAGFRSITVASPHTRDRAELAAADEIVDDMDGIVRALLSARR